VVVPDGDVVGLVETEDVGVAVIDSVASDVEEGVIVDDPLGLGLPDVDDDGDGLAVSLELGVLDIVNDDEPDGLGDVDGDDELEVDGVGLLEALVDDEGDGDGEIVPNADTDVDAVAEGDFVEAGDRVEVIVGDVVTVVVREAFVDFVANPDGDVVED
jgi:hypothetical protein